MVTFPVNDVSQKETYYRIDDYLSPLAKNLERLGKFEAMGGPEKVLATGGPRNGLYAAFQMAYCNHRRLELKPDHIWLQIAGVVARYIVGNAEELRKKFVNFEGQKMLIVHRDHFVKDSPDNDWPGAFDEFAKQIDENVHADVARIFACDFTTSGPVERAVSKVVLMDAMSKYFKYGMVTCSGIPEITLLGDKKDWCDLFTKVSQLGDLLEGIRPWLHSVCGFVNQCILAISNAPDTEWWQSVYMERGGSGVEAFNGHLTILFPDKKTMQVPRQVSGDQVPEAFSKVPMIWYYHGAEFRMQLTAGVPFATVTSEGAITPSAVWGVEEVR